MRVALAEHEYLQTAAQPAGAVLLGYGRDMGEVDPAGSSEPAARGRGWLELREVEHRFVDVGGLRMHVVTAGPPVRADAPELPVVLLHGFPQHWWAWRHVIPAFAAERPVIAVDLRGFGWTDAPAGSSALAVHLADVVGLLDLLGLRRVHVVAHDWAEIVAVRLALDHPGRVGGLVVLALPHPWLTFDVRLLPQIARAWHVPLLASPLAPRLAGRGQQRVIRHLFAAFAQTEGAIGPGDLESYLERLRDPTRARASRALYSDLIIPEFRRVMRGAYEDEQLTVPTVSIVGAADPFADPRMLGRYDEHADDLTIELVENAGHYLHEERPDVVVALAGELFARVR